MYYDMSRNAGALPCIYRTNTTKYRNIMKTINKLTALSVALRYLKETHEIAIHRLMPWKLLWHRSNQFRMSYQATGFDFDDAEQLAQIIQDASISKEFLKEEFGECSDDCLETVIHYADLLEGILADIIQVKKRQKMLNLCHSTEEQKQIEEKYPLPDYLTYHDRWSESSKGFRKCIEAVGFCSETRWIVNWLLMSIGVMTVENLVLYNWPSLSEGCDSYAYLPLNSWLAWEPLFVIHQITASIFIKYFWSVNPKKPSLLKIVAGREFLDNEIHDRGGENDDEILYGHDLHVFTVYSSRQIGTTMLFFKEWGYSVDEAWEFFKPENGFFSRIFQPSALCQDGYDPVDEDIVADEIFRNMYVPELFTKLIGMPSTISSKKKRKK